MEIIKVKDLYNQATEKNNGDVNSERERGDSEILRG